MYRRCSSPCSRVRPSLKDKLHKSEGEQAKRLQWSHRLGLQWHHQFDLRMPTRYVPSNSHRASPLTDLQTLQTKFTQGFLNNATSSNPPPTMLKTAVPAQHAIQHPKTPHDLTKSSNTKITFAHTQTTAGPSAMKQHHSRTPGTAYKSSPQYPNGDSISLPDIASDSEASDDEDEFQPPDWANSPALRELLQQQQLVDPVQVFGPIAPLMMEEVFKGNKERQAKFRARTSSANWNGPDRLTEEERRRDYEARERLERNGGWVYGAST